MRLTLILADSAQVADGKLFVLGGGWTFTGPQPTPHAVGAILEVPYDRANTQINLSLELRGEDGAPVTQHTPAGDESLSIRAQIEVGRPPGHPQGAPLSVPFAFAIPALPLPPGRYVWEADIAGEPRHEDWHLAFQVRGAVRLM